MKHLGSAQFIESSKYQTTIVGGCSDADAVDCRIESLKAKIDQADSLEECDSHQKRIARLASGVAVIRVGGSTEVEMTERKHRIEDALEAVKSAQEEGIVAGGGTALYRAGSSIVMITNSVDQALGGAIIQAAASAPIRQMALNAGESPDLVVEAVRTADISCGWDFRTGELTNLLDNGIIDPVKVTRTALQNAASCAGTLITTNFGIIQTGDK
jgi:chaperonin GroEL